MSNEQSIAVIIPAYNVEEYLPRCIESVLAQSFPATQILITDDGSTDRTGEICEQYAQAHPFITVIRQKNAGVSAARNVALKKVTSRYFVFLDADDALEANALERLMEVQMKVPGALVAADRVTVSVGPDQTERVSERKGAYHGRKILTSAEARRSLCSGEYALQSACHKLFETERAKGIFFDPSILHGEDRLYVYQYLKRCERVAFFPDGLWKVYEREASASRKAPDMRWMGMIRAMDFLAADEEDPEIRNVYRRTRMDTLVLYITAHLWRKSSDEELLEELRRETRAGLKQYVEDGASRHDVAAARMYAYFPVPLLRLYLKLKGKEI